MEVYLDPGSHLSQVKYFERRGEVALQNISRCLLLIERSYIEAVDSFQKAIAYLQRQLDTLQPYRFLPTRSKDPKCSEEEKKDVRPSSPDKFSPASYETPLFLCDHALDPSTQGQHNKQIDHLLEEKNTRIKALELMVDSLSQKLSVSQNRLVSEENARFMAERDLILLRQHRPFSTDVPPDLSSALYESVYNCLEDSASLAHPEETDFASSREPDDDHCV